MYGQIIVSTTINSAAEKSEMILSPLLQVNPAPSSVLIINQTPQEITETEPFDDFRNYKDTSQLNYNLTSLSPGLIPESTVSPFQFTKELEINTNIGDRSIPLDNAIAVSPENWIVSISNGLIEFYNEDQLVLTMDLKSFTNKNLNRPCDPKILYDHDYERFVLMLQECEQDKTNTSIIVAFSKSSNPTGNWNMYKLSGNPTKQSNHWFDYPKMSLGPEELIITGNIFEQVQNRDEFIEAVIYQIDKRKGFKGDSLSYRVWSKIANQPFTLLPFSFDYSDRSNTEHVFVNTSFVRNADFIRMYSISGNIYDDSAIMNFNQVPTTPYLFFAQAVQPGGNALISNGDLRIQDGIRIGRNLYFVFTSGDNDNFSRINLNRLNLSDLSMQSILIGKEDNSSYAFPSIGLMSRINGPDTTLLIQSNLSGINRFPSISLTSCDIDLNCSEEILAINGNSNITNHTRWGDYTTIAKGSLGKAELWASASYGLNTHRQSYLIKLVDTNDPLFIENEGGPNFEPGPLTESVLYNENYITESFNLMESEVIQILRTNEKGDEIVDRTIDLPGEYDIRLYKSKENAKGEYIVRKIEKSTKKILLSKWINKN